MRHSEEVEVLALDGKIGPRRVTLDGAWGSVFLLPCISSMKLKK